MIRKNTVLNNSQNSTFLIALSMHTVDDIIRLNLIRLIEKYAGGNQRQFAAKVGIDSGLLNQIINEHKDLGKPLMERICKALNIKFYEFLIEPDVPMIIDKGERDIVKAYREAKKYGIQQEIVKYAEWRANECRASYGKGKDKALKDMKQWATRLAMENAELRRTIGASQSEGDKSESSSIQKKKRLRTA